MNADLALAAPCAASSKLAGQLRFVQRAGTALTALIAASWLWQARQTHIMLGLAAEKTALAEMNQHLVGTQEEQLIHAQRSLLNSLRGTH
jgi:hypothetical protein